MNTIDSNQDNPSADLTDTIGYCDAAALLGIAIGTLYAWVHQRRIPHYRIGRRCVRFSRGALLRFLDEREVTAEYAPGHCKAANT